MDRCIVNVKNKKRIGSTTLILVFKICHLNHTGYSIYALDTEDCTVLYSVCVIATSVQQGALCWERSSRRWPLDTSEQRGDLCAHAPPRFFSNSERTIERYVCVLFNVLTLWARKLKKDTLLNDLSNTRYERATVVRLILVFSGQGESSLVHVSDWISD